MKSLSTKPEPWRVQAGVGWREMKEGRAASANQVHNMRDTGEPEAGKQQEVQVVGRR